jgi:hypothetical protein
LGKGIGSVSNLARSGVTVFEGVPRGCGRCIYRGRTAQIESASKILNLLPILRRQYLMFVFQGGTLMDIRKRHGRLVVTAATESCAIN